LLLENQGFWVACNLLYQNDVLVYTNTGRRCEAIRSSVSDRSAFSSTVKPDAPFVQVFSGFGGICDDVLNVEGE